MIHCIGLKLIIKDYREPRGKVLSFSRDGGGHATIKGCSALDIVDDLSVVLHVVTVAIHELKVKGVYKYP